MLTDTLNLFPKPVVAGLVIYCLICAALADTFAARRAERLHIPACMVGLDEKEAAARYGQPSDREVARQLARSFFKSFPTFKQLPGVRELGSRQTSQHADERAGHAWREVPMSGWPGQKGDIGRPRALGRDTQMACALRRR